MKACPFCAEEIQDAAKVCKHCGRDLVSGASQVQLVQPPKKTSAAAMSCLVILGVFVVILIVSSFTSRSTPPAPVAAPVVAKGTPPPAGKGKFRTHSYDYVNKAGALVFTFDPALPADDAVFLDAVRELLSVEFKADTRNAQTRIAGPSLRVITGGGIYDATPVKDSRSGKVLGMMIRPVK